MTEEEIKGNEHRVIRLADFHYIETLKGKGKTVNTRESIARNIVCVGSDTDVIASNNKFILRLYQEVYGKDKWQGRYEDKALRVTHIVLKKALSLSLAPEHL